MECENCKKTIPSDSKFCVHCGKKVEKKDTKKDDKDIEIPKDLSKDLSDVRNHLEFMGYEAGENQIEENGIIRFSAVNANRSNLFITYLPSANALLFSATYNIKDSPTEVKKQKLLDVANQINNNTILSTFTIGTEFNTITGSSWYPSDAYSKKQFSNFLDLFENEIIRTFRLDILQEFI